MSYPTSYFVGMLIFCVDSGEEEEKEEPEVHGTALTSTSHTLVLSEERRAAEESSPPPQQNVETSTPTASPRAPSPKRARIGAGDSHAIVAGSSSIPSLDDVSLPFLLDLLFYFASLFLIICRVFSLLNFFF
jgi:hypothetical protein